jgi:hypothetical protein
MPSKVLGQVLGQVMVLSIGLGFSGVGLAQPKNKAKSSEAGGDKTIEKQSAWEQGVMGEDSAKKSDLRKIAAAQKLADQTRKNPPPIAAPKVKDPSKEGVRAKQEANIGLPIASDEAANTKASRKGPAGSGNATARKVAPPTSSANDELGSLVASSLAEDKVSQSGRARSGFAVEAASTGSSTNDARANRARGAERRHAKGRAHAKSRTDGVAGRSSPGALDQLFAAGK